MQSRKPPLPALTVKLSKYNVDDVALGVCKTGAEEAGVTEVRTSLSEKKIGRAVQQECRDRSTLFPYTTLFRSTVKLSKYNVDDVALGVCKTGAEEAGVTEVRTSLSEKKFELWREIKV